MTARRSATIVGSGPNGLAAAITLARGGCDVTILEAADVAGGGLRSAELTLPGFSHDICSAVHPLGIASPFFRSLPLQDFGLTWIQPPVPVAHPLDDGTAVLLERSLDATSSALGDDARAYERMFAPMVRDQAILLDAMLAPLLPPRHPFRMARFGWSGIRSARGLARSRFRGERARALFAGLAAHAILPLESMATASFGLTLGMLGDTVGWPIARGGSQSIADALVGYFKSLGGTLITGHRVLSVEDLPESDLVLFDTDVRQFVAIAGKKLPSIAQIRLNRFRYGAAAFKIDWALTALIPWRAAECARSATVHLGGTLDEICASERASHHGEHAEKPFVLLTQPSLFDNTRAPGDHHTAWAYCHVPNGSTVDMTQRIERQVERFAPGFCELVLQRHVMGPAELQRHNPNYVGGDIVGGSNEFLQLLARPTVQWDPYATAVKGWFLCSASTPPGGGVHGMAGYHAARSALRSLGIP